MKCRTRHCRDFPGKHVPCPTYPEIRLTFFAGRALARALDAYKPDVIHIATEGPLGLSARRYCHKRGVPFTTAYHTRFPEYVYVRFKIPLAFSYVYFRWFHAAAHKVMVVDELLRAELEARGFKHVVLWSRGVDHDIFMPEHPAQLSGAPIFMYMGRVAVEKGIEHFLELDVPGKKYVVGDGPAKKALEARFPDAVFVGYKFGRELASYLAAASVFVFPSRTDTFGLVMLEANACGVPVAAVDSQAARTVIHEGENGTIAEDGDLRAACLRALTLSRARAREVALEHDWKHPTETFLKHVS